MANPKLLMDPNWYVGDAVADVLEVGGFGYGRAIKAVTFADTDAAVPLFTVTGDVVARVVAICKTDLTSAGGCNVEVGITGATAAIITTTDALDIDADDIWHDAVPDSDIEAASIAGFAGFIISGGADIILTPSLQVDTGAITFYCFWTPLSANGNVVAA
jgi:hypothetical protein